MDEEYIEEETYIDQHENNDENKNDEVNDLIKNEQIQEKIKNDLKNIWDDILVPHMNNCNSNVLSKLREDDFYKFYGYVNKYSELCEIINESVYVC